MLYELIWDGTRLVWDNKMLVVNWSGGGADEQITTTPVANGDGGTFMSGVVKERQIIINIRVFTEFEKDLVYRLFALKQEQKPLIYKRLDADISQKRIFARVTDVKPQGSALPYTMQVVLLAEFPFWETVEESENVLTGNENAWEFDWEIPLDKSFEFSATNDTSSRYFNNTGTVPTGFKCEIALSQDKKWISLFNYTTGKTLRVNGDFVAGDMILFNTEHKGKGVYTKKVADSEWTEITGQIEWKSEFFLLNAGRNRIFIDSDTGVEGIESTITFSPKFGGV